MKIYVNDRYEIIGLDTEVDGYKEVFDVDKTKEEIFTNLCDSCIYGYKYEPLYEMLFNEDGSNKRDEMTGEFLYKVDNNGNKITNGFSCHPFVNVQTLMLIQNQYDASQKQFKALNKQLEHLNMISGINARQITE